MEKMAARDPRAEQFEAALLRDDPFELQELVLDAALDSELREWAEWACTVLARHRNATVRGNALLGFGHLARHFGILDPNRARSLIETGLYSHHEFVRTQAESAADDIDAYLSWNVERPRS